jgi:hypothetical protein
MRCEWGASGGRGSEGWCERVEKKAGIITKKKNRERGKMKRDSWSYVHCFLMYGGVCYLSVGAVREKWAVLAIPPRPSTIYHHRRPY